MTTYPPAFLERMKLHFGQDFDTFLNALDIDVTTSIRINPFKRSHTNGAEFPKGEQIPWSTNGYFLDKRPSFTFDPLFHSGAYYVQEASSMFLEKVWKQIVPENKSVKVLDLCAAPGGKSTHLLSLLNSESLLVTNELISQRNSILRQNIIKWGCPNVIVTQNKSEDFSKLENYFDVILIDAPCSGEGLFRKDKNAINEWSEKNVEICSERQKDILRNAVGALKPNGYIIYSTCTFEPSENIEQVNWMCSELNLSNEKLAIDAENWAIEKVQKQGKEGYAFYPHKQRGEGFFISILKKDSSVFYNDENTNSSVRKAANVLNSLVLEQVKTYVKGFENFTMQLIENRVYLMPQHLSADLAFLQKNLFVRYSGVMIGEVKGKDFIPSHELALSQIVRDDVASIEVDYEMAIQFLRAEQVSLKGEKRGWNLIRFQGFNLGWAKVLENRSNNYFPKEWRILKAEQ